MTVPRSSELVETILYRAADTVGDIAAPAIALFYQRYPECRALFDHHGTLRVQDLENDMVSQALYCLMNWCSSPGEVEIVLLGSVPHHADTLNVPPDFYRGLLMATAEVIADSIPAKNREERAVWDALCRELCAVIEQGSEHLLNRVAGDPAPARLRHP